MAPSDIDLASFDSLDPEELTDAFLLNRDDADESELMDVENDFSNWLNIMTSYRMNNKDLYKTELPEMVKTGKRISDSLFQKTEDALSVQRETEFRNFWSQLASIQMDDRESKTIEEHFSELSISCYENHKLVAKLESEHRVFVLHWMLFHPMDTSFNKEDYILEIAKEAMIGQADAKRNANESIRKLRTLAKTIPSGLQYTRLLYKEHFYRKEKVVARH
ncbi:hypothetical protein QQX98_009155 [Neonectria punicea]|uniref:Uncharacterized protein n=1 Tax=Neonectria punicea TaxID=979145 RepID=A0ABR1GT76_9HYPO